MKLKLLAPIGSIVAIFGFFSPWMSCGAIKYTGYDLASGVNAGTSAPESDMIIWLVLLAAVIIIALYFLFTMRRQLKKAMIPTIGAAVLGLSILAAKYIDIGKLRSEFNEQAGSKDIEGLGNVMSDSISIEWGYWLTALAFVSSIAGAWNYKDEPLIVTAETLGTPLPDDGSKMNQDLGM